MAAVTTGCVFFFASWYVTPRQGSRREARYNRAFVTKSSVITDKSNGWGVNESGTSFEVRASRIDGAHIAMGWVCVKNEGGRADFASDGITENIEWYSDNSWISCAARRGSGPKYPCQYVIKYYSSIYLPLIIFPTSSPTLSRATFATRASCFFWRKVQAIWGFNGHRGLQFKI